MLVNTSASLLISLLFTLANAAPTRTTCRCTIVSDAPLPAINTPATAHWTPSGPSSSSLPIDICAKLGPELENFQHAKPDLYDSYIRQSSPDYTSDEQGPMTTTVLLDLASRNSFQKYSRPDGENQPSSTSGSQQRIVCHLEAEVFSAHEKSLVCLWAPQIIMAILLLSCLAEGIHLGKRWMERRSESQDAAAEENALRLPGAEKRLLAIPATNVNADTVFSPGAEKKLRAYETTRFFVMQASSGKREFIAYESEDDDEAHRPVM